MAFLLQSWHLLGCFHKRILQRQEALQAKLQLRKLWLILLQDTIIKFSCIFMLNDAFMDDAGKDLPKLEGFSYHAVHLKGKRRWGLLISHLNFQKGCKALYSRQAASMGSDSLHMISGSEFVLETTHVTSSQIQHSDGEYWMNIPGAPWWNWSWRNITFAGNLCFCQCLKIEHGSLKKEASLIGYVDYA